MFKVIVSKRKDFYVRDLWNFFFFVLKIFVAFVIASVLAAPAPAPAPVAAPAPNPHYVSAVPFGYSGYSAYSTPYVASPYVGAYASPYSYAYSPVGKFDSHWEFLIFVIGLFDCYKIPFHL